MAVGTAAHEVKRAGGVDLYYLWANKMRSLTVLRVASVLLCESSIGLYVS